MNVTCPNCATIYRVDPAKVPEAGVRARCAVCAAVFPVRRDASAVASTGSAMAAAPLAPAPSAPASQEPAEGSRPAPVPSSPPAPPTPQAPPPPAAPARPEPPPQPRPEVASRPAASSVPAPPVVPPAAPRPAVSRPAGLPPVAPRPAVPTRAPAAPPAPSGAGAAAPAAGARKPVNPFLSQDPGQKARRLARALISDMVVYHPAKRREGLRDGTLKTLFEDEIKKSWEEYTDQVGKDVAESTTHFKDALNEILADGRQIF